MKPVKYNCLVVDDEPIARRIIINYMQQMPQLQLAGECINALSAIDHLRSHPGTDIIFLDINMPNLSGLQLMKIVQPYQPVIFTTAYAEYAVESYELDAADYLLKPFSFERFAKAVYKAVDIINKPVKGNGEEGVPVLFIKSEGKSYPVPVPDIMYCESMKNYTLLVLKNGLKLTPLIPLSKLDTMVAEAGGDLIQIHRSFLISRKHITAVTPAHVLVDHIEIPIGAQFRERFYREIGMK